MWWRQLIEGEEREREWEWDWKNEQFDINSFIWAPWNSHLISDVPQQLSIIGNKQRHDTQQQWKKIYCKTLYHLN